MWPFSSVPEPGQLGADCSTHVVSTRVKVQYVPGNKDKPKIFAFPCFQSEVR